MHLACRGASYCRSETYPVHHAFRGQPSRQPVPGGGTFRRAVSVGCQRHSSDAGSFIMSWSGLPVIARRCSLPRRSESPVVRYPPRLSSPQCAARRALAPTSGSSLARASILTDQNIDQNYCTSTLCEVRENARVGDARGLDFDVGQHQHVVVAPQSQSTFGHDHLTNLVQSRQR